MLVIMKKRMEGADYASTTQDKKCKAQQENTKVTTFSPSKTSHTELPLKTIFSRIKVNTAG